MEKNPTILRTFKAKIYGVIMKVQELHYGGQDIRYRGDRSKIVLSSDRFWSLEPVIIN